MRILLVVERGQQMVAMLAMLGATFFVGEYVLVSHSTTLCTKSPRQIKISLIFNFAFIVSYLIRCLPPTRSRGHIMSFEVLGQLYEQYGPVVTIAPNEITTISPSAWKDFMRQDLFCQKIHTAKHHRSIARTRFLRPPATHIMPHLSTVSHRCSAR